MALINGVPEVAEQVIDNEPIKALLKNYFDNIGDSSNAAKALKYLNLNHDFWLIPYEHLVRFQALMCGGSLKDVGYQVVEPWTVKYSSSSYSLY